MHVLVTGAAGFLGSHLCESLLDKGYRVTGLDNLYTGSIANLGLSLSNPNFNFIDWDVTIPMNIPVDGIFNLACPASPIHYQKNPVETIRTSFMGALNCLELANKYGAKVLQASTSEVYGDPDVTPQPESYWGNVNPIGIRSCYDEGKRAAETLFFDFHREYKTRIKVARIFNTYGPRMAFEDGRVVSNFVYQSLLGHPITIYGDGSQTRSFCFVDDLIRGLICLFESDDEITGPINLGSSEEISISDLAKIVRKRLPGAKIVHLPLPADDPKQRKPDLNLAFSQLNWKPNIKFDAGVDLIIDDFQKRIHQS